jgi:hypothetical protein
MIPESHHGRFVGSNRLWFYPGTPAHLSDGELEVAADRLTIRWSHEGAPHQGSLVLSGPAPSCAGSFTDSFHAAGGLALHGRQEGAAVRLYGTYPAGEGAPDWGWRIEVDWAVPDRVGLRMFNVEPDGSETIAVELSAGR